MPHVWFCSWKLSLSLCIRGNWEESIFCSKAKIRSAHQNDLFQHCILVQLVRHIFRKAKFIKRHTSKMHYIANVQVEDPIFCMLNSEDVSNVNLIGTFFLYLLKITILLVNKSSLYKLIFNWAFRVLSQSTDQLNSLILTQICNRFKSFNPISQLTKHGFSLSDHSWQNFRFLLNVISHFLSIV